eukprot:TRINITY_DN1761_c0_g1_i1.p1 TRINITY_DN1761_c0_g1~~TRINITY_DN1761_c0_g1_i1.p1  ORF type:complete len:245 (-),score=48.49 TRINITY_DN1761_c0_g1_i1:169-903(-)
MPAVDQLYAQLERQYPVHPKSPELLLRFPRVKLSPRVELDAWRFLAKNYPSDRVPLDELVSAFARHVERLDDTITHDAADPTAAVSPTALQTVVQAHSLNLALLAKPSTREWVSPAFSSADHSCIYDNTWNAIPGVAVTVPGFPRDAYIRIVAQTTIYSTSADASWHLAILLRTTPALAGLSSFLATLGGRALDSSIMTDVVMLPASASPTTFEVCYNTANAWTVYHDDDFTRNSIKVFFEDWA